MLPLERVPLLGREMLVVDALQLVSGSEARRALVVDDGRLEGILSITDLLRALELGEPAGAATR
jgi:CBS domain-containing protein